MEQYRVQMSHNRDTFLLKFLKRFYFQPVCLFELTLYFKTFKVIEQWEKGGWEKDNLYSFGPHAQHALEFWDNFFQHGQHEQTVTSLAFFTLCWQIVTVNWASSYKLLLYAQLTLTICCRMLSVRKPSVTVCSVYANRAEHTYADCWRRLCLN